MNSGTRMKSSAGLYNCWNLFRVISMSLYSADLIQERLNYKQSRKRLITRIRGCSVSGNPDSSAGAVQLLNDSDDNICMLSHQPDTPDVSSYQNRIFRKISELYPGRCRHFKFHCGIKGEQTADNFQMTGGLL